MCPYKKSVLAMCSWVYFLASSLLCIDKYVYHFANTICLNFITKFYKTLSIIPIKFTNKDVWYCQMRGMILGLLWWLSSKESPVNAGDTSSIPGSGRSPGEINGNLLQYTCLENPLDRGAWWATVHGDTKELDRI